MAELLQIAAGGLRDARINALWIASEIATPRDGRMFTRFLDDKDERVRSMAIDGIERTRYRAALPALAAIVNTPRGPLRVTAAYAMAALAGGGVSKLVGYLHDSDPRIREAGCHALWFLYEGRRIAPEIERCTRDPDRRVVAAAKRTRRTIAARA